MNDINNLNLKGKLCLFADDMSLVVEAKDYNQLNSHLNSDLIKISQWLKDNKLVLNYKKCYFMVMGNPRVGSVSHIRPTINNNFIINKVFNTEVN